MRMWLDVGNLILELYNLQPAAVRNTLQSLGRPVSACLEVEGTLVLQPPSVSSNTTNLLAVVVRWGVRERRGSRVDAVTLDAVEEG